MPSWTPAWSRTPSPRSPARPPPRPTWWVLAAGAGGPARQDAAISNPMPCQIPLPGSPDRTGPRALPTPPQSLPVAGAPLSLVLPCAPSAAAQAYSTLADAPLPCPPTLPAWPQVMVFGEITTRAKVDYEAVVRKTCKEIGFISDDVGLDADKCKVRAGAAYLPACLPAPPVAEPHAQARICGACDRRWISCALHAHTYGIDKAAGLHPRVHPPTRPTPAGPGAHRGAEPRHWPGRARHGHQDPGGDWRRRPGGHTRDGWAQGARGTGAACGGAASAARLQRQFQRPQIFRRPRL